MKVSDYKEAPDNLALYEWDVVELEGLAVTIPSEAKVDSPWAYTWLLREATLKEAVFFAMGFNCSQVTFANTAIEMRGK